MVFGEDMSSSSRAQGALGEVANGSRADESSSAMASLLARSDPPSSHLRTDVHPDEDPTRSVIDRGMKFVAAEYPSWTDAITRVALGAVLMSKTRGITMQEQVHFLHLSQGSNYIRAHAGQTYLFENGSFRLFNGVLPESTLQRCMEFAARVEGCLWCIEKRCMSREEVDIFAALGRAFCAITADSGHQEPVGDLRGAADPVSENRGTKRVRRWLDYEGSFIPNLSTPLDEKKIFIALHDLSLDKWEGAKRYRAAQLLTWGSQEAVNCQEMAKKLSTRMESADIIPFYAEYMETDRIFPPGIALEDVCLVYDPITAGERNGRIMKQVDKGPRNNIYTHIERSLTDPIHEEAEIRLRDFLQTTFCNNGWALKCTIAGIALALMGEDVDRAFWSIGEGAFG